MIESVLMPVIARFYGILVKMYFREHGVPHFHAIYGEYNGVFEIETLEMIEGDLPQRAERLVREWASRCRSDLQEMWRTQSLGNCRGWNDKASDFISSRQRSKASA